MKRNRKVKKHSRFTMNSVNTVALIVLSFLALMVYWSQDTHCATLAQEIGRAEKELKRLESDYHRELSSWDAQKTTDKLHQQSIYHGLDMEPTKPEQIVRMGANGLPLPGQISVARINARRSRMDRMAVVENSVRSRRLSSSRVAAPNAGKRSKVRR